MQAKFVKQTISFCVLIISLCIFIACQGHEVFSEFDQSAESGSSLKQILLRAHIPEYHFQIINTYPHDSHSFTEGLIWKKPYLYESAGLYGQSTLRKIEIKTGNTIQQYRLPPQYFAEGLTLLGDQLYQLTYRENTGFIYDINTFQVKNRFSYLNEGWGLTNNGQQLIMSDGTSILTFIDPQTLKPLHTLSVKVGNYTINHLNELQFIKGLIYANVWPTSIIVIISPQNGIIKGWIDIKALKPSTNCIECVANGIAYNDQDNLLFVTGKNWPFLYEIKIASKK